MSFLDSFFRVEVEYDEINRMYTVSGPLRLGPAYSKYNNFSKNAFTVAESSKCVFHEVFLPEVIAWFSWLLNHNSVNANVTLLGRAITELFALEKKQVETSTKYDLDLNIAKAVMDKDLLPYWIPVFEGYGEYKRRTHNRGLLIAAAAGSGKMSRNTSLVRVPGGWKQIGKLRVGNLVMAPDGTYTKVVGVFPQGKKQLYRITFSDGRTHECGWEHLWEVNIDRVPFKYLYYAGFDTFKNTHILTTGQLVELLEIRKKMGADWRFYIRLTEPEKNHPRSYFIHPYILGCILGDGNITSGSISLTISSDEVIERIRQLLPYPYVLTKTESKERMATYRIVNSENNKYNGYIAELRRLNLMGKNSLEKFIPEDYLNGSYEQRLELIRGLMDTDGCVGKNGNISYGTSSQQLAKDAALLFRSMGDMVYTGKYVPLYTYKGEKLKGNNSYSLFIRTRNPKLYFTRPGRADRAKETNQYSYGLKLRIENIEKIDIDYATCIAVSHPSKLYVAEDYVVTHNTSSSLAIAEMLMAKKILVISPNNAVYKVWVKSIAGYGNEKSEYKNPKNNKVWTISDMGSYKDERFIIVNYEALDKLLPMINKIAGKDTVVIIDESHNFADQKSKRTNLLIDILDKSMSQNVLLLSGTPIKSYSTEIINIARMVNTDIRGDIFVRLSNIYRNTPNYLKDILITRFQNLSFTIEKKELALDPVIKTYVPVTLKNGDDYTLDKIRNDMKVYINDRISFIEKHRDSYNKAYAIYIEQILKAGWEKKSKYTYQEYRKLFDEIQMAANRNMLRLYTTQIALCNRIEKEMAQFLPPISRDDWHETKTILKYPMLKIQGECLGKIVMGARVKCHMDIAKELDYLDILSNTVKKTIIFSNYIEVCEQAKQAVSMLKLNPVTVYGENTKNLTKEVDIFSKDKKRNPLITTYKSLSTAVPLTVANVVIAIDLPFRMYIFEQAISRVWRNGQDTQVLVYIPTLDTGSKDNINQRNFDIISFFNQAVEEMTGFKSSLDIDETVKSIAAQPFINLENLSVATDILYSDFNYTAYLDTSITNRMIKWR